ncbi:MAG: ParA family protein [Planctomycetota bacterium]
MKRIAVINQKGGVGKTTTTVNLGAALAHHGRRVLLLDLDPQANMTVHVDKRPDLESDTLTNLLIDDTPLGELIQGTSLENLSVVPSDTSLAGVEQVLANRIGRETILRQALDNAKAEERFDFVLFDCPPSLGVLSANALVAADWVVIPMQAEYLSLQGMAKLLEVIDLVQKQLNPNLQIACVLPCMLDSRTNLSAEVLSEIDHHFGPLLTTARIRNNVKLAEAPSFGRTIFEHAPESNGAKDYAAFALEFLEKIGEHDSPAAEDTASEPLASSPAASDLSETTEDHSSKGFEPESGDSSATEHRAEPVIDPELIPRPGEPPASAEADT